MSPILLQQPSRILFGIGCAVRGLEEIVRLKCRRVLVVSGPKSGAAGAAVFHAWRNEGIVAELYDKIDREPDFEMFDQALVAARAFRPDAVVGFGGGSPLDVAKLVAALLDTAQPVREAFGIGRVMGRSTPLLCIPTTAGTGSEVSPNAVLLDEVERLKKGAVSPYLVPDVAILDPELTVALSPAVTAATGIDALVHCMEAYANKHAHPAVDVYAVEGMRRIAGSIETAVKKGTDRAARSDVMLGALYGGLCLGPVNTAAVHALSYPLGGEYHIPHGVANSLLVPHVFRFNLPAMPERYAAIAQAIGAPERDSVYATAEAGLEHLERLSRACGIPERLRDFGLAEADLPRLAQEAMKVTRLLKNNPRELTVADAEAIYRAAF